MASTTEMIQESLGMITERMQGEVAACITGSSLMEDDFSLWESAPDIDLFAYSPYAMVHAIDVIEYGLGGKPLNKGEAWKIARTRRYGANHKSYVTTSKLVLPTGIVANVSYKKNQTQVVDVLSNFDMTIVMQGIDLLTGYRLDLRGDDRKTAVPNPLRPVDSTLFGTQEWVRQFDRVIKYWNRGYDTRPMARFYVEMIDDSLSQGALFETEKAKSLYDQVSEEFVEIRSKIERWLKDKEE